MKTDVIIVGAGPSGLALAGQLIRYGVDFVILDKKETTTPFSKAIGVQARTLEIYEQIGLADKLISLGAIAGKARMIVGGEVRGGLQVGAGLRLHGVGAQDVLSPGDEVVLAKGEIGVTGSLVHDDSSRERVELRCFRLR